VRGLGLGLHLSLTRLYFCLGLPLAAQGLVVGRQT
jgi:hypothetical protein